MLTFFQRIYKVLVDPLKVSVSTLGVPVEVNGVDYAHRMDSMA